MKTQDERFTQIFSLGAMCLFVMGVFSVVDHKPALALVEIMMAVCAFAACRISPAKEAEETQESKDIMVIACSVFSLISLTGVAGLLNQFMHPGAGIMEPIIIAVFGAGAALFCFTRIRK